MKVKTKTTIQLKSVLDIKDLISDLKRELRMAKRTAGIRYVYRVQGNQKVVFEMQVPMDECL